MKRERGLFLSRSQREERVGDSGRGKFDFSRHRGRIEECLTWGGGGGLFRKKKEKKTFMHLYPNPRNPVKKRIPIFGEKACSRWASRPSEVGGGGQTPHRWEKKSSVLLTYGRGVTFAPITILRIGKRKRSMWRFAEKKGNCNHYSMKTGRPSGEVEKSRPKPFSEFIRIP